MRRESTEEFLRESEERYRRLAELSPDAIAVQSEGKVAYVNAAGLKLLGVTCLEEVLGRPVLDFVHPDFHEAARAWMRQVEKGRPATLMEQRWVWPDGRVVDVEVASAPITYQGRPSSQIVVRDITGRKRMEGELREAEAKYRRLVEQIPAATYRRELGEDAAIMYVSPQIEAILGYSPEEYVSDPELWMRIIHPDDRERVMDEDARAGRSGEPFRMEYRKFARDGRTVWVRDEAIVVDDENGEPLYRQGIVLDITESKLTEQGLRRSEARNRAILDAGPDLMFLFNRAGEFLDFRAPDTAELYVPSESIVGSKLADVMPAEVTDKALDLIRRALDSGETQTFEYELPASEGLRQLEARLVKSGADEVLAVVRDITERKRAELALKESEQRFRQLFNQSVDALFVHDEKGKIVDCNEEACRSLGYTREELLAMSAWDIADDLLSEEERRERERRGGTLWQRITAGEPVMPAVAHFGEHKRKDGTKFPIEVRVGGVDYRGRRMILASVRDITERKRAEEALRASEANLVMGQRLAHLGSYDMGPLNDGTPWMEQKMRWSDEMYRILGFAPREFVPTFEILIEAIHPDDLERVTSIVRDSMSRSETSLGLEHRIIRPDGEVRTVRAQVETIFGKRAGMPLRQFGTLLDITEQERAERQIRESEERYRAVVEQSTEAIWVFDPDTKQVLESNTSFQQMLGYTAEELQHLTNYDFVAHSRENVDAAVERIVRNRRGFFGDRFGERKYRCKDGALLDVEASGTIIPYGDKKAVCGVVRDMTEIKRVQTALKESEERHRRQVRELSLLHQVRTVLAQELDLPVVFRTVVEAIADTYGYAQVSAYLLDGGELMLQHQVGYKSVIERVPLDKGIMGRVARTGEPVLLRDVRDAPAFLGAIEGVVSEVGVPLFDEGRVVGVLNVESTDGIRLTQDDLRLMSALGEHVGIAIGRARLYTRVRESEERFRALLQNASDVITLLDGDGTVRYESPSIERILGYQPEELIGKNVFDYVHPEDLERVLNTFTEGLADSELPRFVEYRFRCKDGSWRHLESVGNNLLDDPGVGQLVINSRDITERKQAEQRLEESEQRYKSLYEHNPDAVYSFDLEGNFLSANPACEEVSGYTTGELIGRSFAPLIVPEDLEKTLRHFEKAANGEPQNYEIAISHKLGHRVDVNVTNLPIVVASEIVGVYGIAKNITERKQEEQARARLAAIVESSDDAIISRTLDGVITSWNPGAERLYGYSAREVVGRSGSFLYPPEHPGEMSEILEKIQRGESIEHYETERMTKSGRRVCVSLSVSPISDAAGNIIGDSGIARDITERKRTEEALRESEERYRAVVEQSAEAIWIFDPDTKRVLESNTSFQELLGYTAEELREMTNYDFVAHSREDIDALVQLKVREGKSLPSERKYRRKDGTLLDVEVGGAMISYQSKRVVCSVARDLTERKALEERLTYRAFHDPLTDLPNRTLFLDRLQHALARAGRQMSSIAVLYVDLDNFKIINDSLGHETGDRVLVEAGLRLRSCLRPADTVARLGGDEFIVLLENNAGVREATWISERILEKFRSPLLLEGQETFITPSIGIFLAGPDNLPEEILRNADLAMYRSKEKGKAQYEVFDLAMYDRTLERRKLEVDLKQGVERGELRVYYQPKVRLDTGKIIGMEALARWDHPGLGIILPEEFIPVAEETGLIIPLGQWILKEACEQGREWQAQYPEDPPLEMCVNLSARQFQRHDLVKEIAGVLKETGLDPRSLVLEITESVIMAEAESSIAILEELKDLGVQLAIDDFGTGYSSLSYLNRFPVDSLKIDRSFIEGLPEGPEDTAVVSSIITLTHTLGMQVTAEGVETDQQLSQLRKIGCDLAQGLCFAEPLACEAASALLADDPRW